MSKAKTAIRDRTAGEGWEEPEQLLANPRNWRVHNAQQEAALGTVLSEVGWVQRVVVNRRSGFVVDGHLRVAHAISLGEKRIPVQYVDLSEQEEALILASLDPLSAMAGTDKKLLDDLLSSINDGAEGIADLLDSIARDHHIERLPAEGLTDPDAVPELPAEPTTKHGDLWLLGDHRVLCGDSTSATDVARLMGGERAGCVFTSPPYLQQRTYEGNMAPDWDALMRDVFAMVLTAAEPGAQVFVNLGLVHRDGRVIRYWDSLIAFMESSGWPLFGWYVWDKMAAFPGDWNGRLGPAHEWLFHFAVEHERPAKTVATKTSPNIRKSHTMRNPDGTLKEFTGSGEPVQPFKIPDSVLRFTNPGRADAGHPATFPVSLPTAFIEAWPARLWFDPFLGSGTTVIACEQLGRRCYGLEIEPRYVDVTVRRWEQFTGKKAVLSS